MKLEGGGALTLGLGPFLAAAAAAAAASASFFACLSAALLFVLGAIVGAPILLGRGFGLAAGVAAPVPPFDDVVDPSSACPFDSFESAVLGRTAATDEARGTA